MLLRHAAHIVACALAITACAAATNYPEADGPRFAGHYAVAGGADSLLRVVTYNIQFSRHIDAAIATLGGTPALRNPDVLALQEMDERGVEQIARALALNYVYYPSAVHPANDRNFGNAILSPWPIIESRKLILPHRSFHRQLARAAVVATVLVGDTRLRVYSVHLETALGLSGRGRRDQVQALLADVARSPDPVVLAGDLNSHALGTMFAAAGFLWPSADVGPTVHAFSWDHIFVRGFGLSTVPEAGVVANIAGASDHRPVWVVLSPAPPLDIAPVAASSVPAAQPRSSS